MKSTPKKDTYQSMLTDDKMSDEAMSQYLDVVHTYNAVITEEEMDEMVQVFTDQLNSFMIGGKMSKIEYTWNDLVDLTEAKLLEIKKEKQRELYAVKQNKLAIVTQIISLQGMIQTEKIIINNEQKEDN